MPPRSPAGTTTRPSGFRRSEAILATSLVVATPTDAVSPTSVAGLVLDPPGDRRAVAEQGGRPGDVEERLVDRDRLDQRRVAPEDRHDVSAGDLVATTVDRQEHGVRAAAVRLAQRHRRVDPERARLVARRRHDARARPRRPQPPTTTGRPRSSGRSRCSTAAKKASRSTCRIVRSVMVAIIDPLWNPLPMTVPAPGPSPPPAIAIGAGRAPDPRRRRDRRLARPADVDRPRLADPVLRPGLGRHPAGRPRPADAGRGRRGDRHQRLRLGPPRERRRAADRVRARRRSSSARSSSPRGVARRRQRPPPMAGAAPSADPRRHRACPAADAPAWIVAVAAGLAVARRPRAATAGTRRPTAGSRAAGTGATCSSTSRSARASRPATSRPRSPTSPASR